MLMFWRVTALTIPVFTITIGTSFGAVGIYTQTQAAAGSTAYTASCAVCHGGSLQGGAGPALKGTQFRQMAAAQALTAGSLLSVITKLMPQTAPGSLTPTQYSDITAYILQQNGYPSGSDSLKAGSSSAKTLSLSQ